VPVTLDPNELAARCIRNADERNEEATPVTTGSQERHPAYRQIQQRLLEQIQSGELRQGEPLPSIQRIAALMGVSQMTVRQAVKSLCDLGVIYSRQGKGTFISGSRWRETFARFFPLPRK